jgi:hypothetical protein
MAAWPGTLPEFFQVGGFVEIGADNVIRSPMDVGPDKLRLRTTASTRRHTGNMWLTTAQYTALRTFFETTQSYGALSFTMDDAHGVNKTFRFLNPPRYNTVGPNNWQVKLDLEEMP